MVPQDEVFLHESDIQPTFSPYKYPDKASSATYTVDEEFGENVNQPIFSPQAFPVTVQLFWTERL